MGLHKAKPKQRVDTHTEKERDPDTLRDYFHSLVQSVGRHGDGEGYPDEKCDVLLGLGAGSVKLCCWRVKYNCICGKCIMGKDQFPDYKVHDTGSSGPVTPTSQTSDCSIDTLCPDTMSAKKNHYRIGYG